MNLALPQPVRAFELLVTSITIKLYYTPQSRPLRSELLKIVRASEGDARGLRCDPFHQAQQHISRTHFHKSPDSRLGCSAHGFRPPHTRLHLLLDVRLEVGCTRDDR